HQDHVGGGDGVPAAHPHRLDLRHEFPLHARARLAGGLFRIADRDGRVGGRALYLVQAAGLAVAVRHTTLGIVLKLGATLNFSLMYVLIRLAGPVPVGEGVFFRGFFALVPLFLFSFATTGPRAVTKTARPWLHLRRSIAGTASMFLNFYAVRLLPLADVTAFSFVTPIF